MKQIEKEILALKELEEIKIVIKDLFIAIELSEDEDPETRFNSMETYLRRLSKFNI